MKKMFNFDIDTMGELPRYKGLFITGTDTEIGKTLVTGAIARCLRKAGRYVEVYKPIASGCKRVRGDLESEDGQFLAACAGSKLTLAEITPVRYASPVAPNLAAEIEGRAVDLQAIFDAYAHAGSQGEGILVEGVGGLLCPLTDDFWVIHLARMMGLPLVIVASGGLGTINHTLLTIHAARSAGLDVAGVVINRIDAVSPDESMMTNPTQIAQRGGVEILAMIPDEPGNSVESATLGSDTEFAIAQADWAKLMGLAGMGRNT